jgi:hypothetical protein
VQQAESKGAAAVATAHHGGHPRVYTEELLLLDWLLDWPVLAVACGLPRDAQGVCAFPVRPRNASVRSRPARRGMNCSSSSWYAARAISAWSAAAM